MTLQHRRSVLGLVLALAPLAARAAGPGKPPPADGGFQFADASRCGGGSAFEVVNAGAEPIMEIYLRPASTSGWGADLLGDAVLKTQERKQLDPGIGVYDLLLLRADGRSFTAMRQSACRINRVVLNADGTLRID